MKNDFDTNGPPDETPSKKLKIRTLKAEGETRFSPLPRRSETERACSDLLRSFQCFFEFHHNVTKENIRQERNEVKPLGKIHLQWTSEDPTQIHKFILRWFSSKNPQVKEKTFGNTQTSFIIGKVSLSLSLSPPLRRSVREKESNLRWI